MYTESNFIESLVNGIQSAKKTFVRTVFAANDLYVECESKLRDIRKEYIVVDALCYYFLMGLDILKYGSYIFAKNLLCNRVEPLCTNEWSKISYISYTDVYYDVYYDKSLLLNPFHILTDNGSYCKLMSKSFIEVYIYNDEEIAVLNNPDYIRDYSFEDTMLFTRKLATGERIVRQLYPETISPNFKEEICALNCPEKSNVRFLLVYVQVENPLKMYDIDIPIEEYYVGNELLSHEYVVSYFDHRWIWESYGIGIKTNYVIRLMDSNFQIYEMKRGEYLRLEKDGFRIFAMEEDEEDEEEEPIINKEETKEEPFLEQSEQIREVRSVSLEEDAETLLLFSRGTEPLDCPSPDEHKNKKLKVQ